jgi:RNA polymerase sigma factor (sigma-70 family)
MVLVKDAEKNIKVALEKGDLDTAMINCEPLIKMQLNRLNLWKNFQSSQDDFIQDAKINILKALTKFENRSAVMTYIYAVIKFSLYNTLRSNGLYKHMKEDVELNPDVHEGEFTEHALNLYDSVLNDIYNYHIADQRAVLVDHFINELSIKETAKSQNISYTTAYVYITTFKARMQRKYYGSGGANEYEVNSNSRANEKRKVQKNETKEKHRT